MKAVPTDCHSEIADLALVCNNPARSPCDQPNCVLRLGTSRTDVSASCKRRTHGRVRRLRRKDLLMRRLTPFRARICLVSVTIYNSTVADHSSEGLRDCSKLSGRLVWKLRPGSVLVLFQKTHRAVFRTVSLTRSCLVDDHHPITVRSSDVVGRSAKHFCK